VRGSVAEKELFQTRGDGQALEAGCKAGLHLRGGVAPEDLLPAAGEHSDREEREDLQRVVPEHAVQEAEDLRDTDEADEAVEDPRKRQFQSFRV